MRVVADLDDKYPPPSAYFERAVCAEVLHFAGIYKGDPERLLKERYPDDKHSADVLSRAIAPVGTTTGSGFASQIVQTAFKSFLLSLAPMSAAADLIKRGIALDLGAFGDARFPSRSGSPTAAPWVAEGEPIPVVSRTFAAVQVGPRRKVALIAVVTGELSRAGNGEIVVTTVLREDVAASLDAAYFSSAAASTSAHAGLLNGVSPLTGASGGDLLAMQADLMALAAAVAAGGSGQVVFITSPANAAIFPIRAPEMASKITMLPSLAVADTRVIAVDPLSLVHGTDPDPDLSVSREAIVHMSDVPLEIVSDTGPTTADPVRSMYQTDCIAIRIMADIAFAKRRSGAVAYMDGVDWNPA